MILLINYHTGVVREVEVENLEEAKEIAKEGISYTQENVTIEDKEGNVLTTAYWYGVKPDEDDSVLVQFGDYGFYCLWQTI